MQFFHMHTKGDVQPQAVKLFVNIVSQVENIDIYLLP